MHVRYFAKQENQVNFVLKNLKTLYESAWLTRPGPCSTECVRGFDILNLQFFVLHIITPSHLHSLVTGSPLSDPSDFKWNKEKDKIIHLSLSLMVVYDQILSHREDQHDSLPFQVVDKIKFISVRAFCLNKFISVRHAFWTLSLSLSLNSLSLSLSELSLSLSLSLSVPDGQPQCHCVTVSWWIMTYAPVSGRIPVPVPLVCSILGFPRNISRYSSDTMKQWTNEDTNQHTGTRKMEPTEQWPERKEQGT